MTLRVLIAIFMIPAVAAVAGESPLKKVVVMTRTIPPSTNAGASRVRVIVATEHEDALPGAENLKNEITSLVARWGTLASLAEPLITIDVSLSGVETGERYGLNVTGTWEIAAQGVDIASGSFERHELLEVAREISAHLVPTTESVRVLAPRSWRGYLQVTPPYQVWHYDSEIAATPAENAEDEAYRQYALALSKEAHAYQPSQSREESLALLQTALDHLDEAIRRNPNEQWFNTDHVDLRLGRIGNPRSRISDSLARYEKWIPQPVVWEPGPVCNSPMPELLIRPPDN